MLWHLCGLGKKVPLPAELPVLCDYWVNAGPLVLTTSLLSELGLSHAVVQYFSW